jgi:NAD(P)-dependent dehydrogenase (short-subunit alcohol dehydrogenase family)
MSNVFVTGSSTGIGQATALALARAGHHVIASMRRPEAGSDLADIARQEKLALTIAALDVTSDASVSDAFTAAERQYGAIDVLVNNAGIGQTGAIEDVSLDDFRRVMETNYFGALRCIKAVVPGMRERRRGCIINITSVAGRLAGTPQAPYASSKFALEALSEVLAQEMRLFGVRVAIVEPGVIATPIFEKAPELKPSLYPGTRRLRALFAASLTAVQVPPDVVATKIREIVESDTLVLRHPVGPDAMPMIARRQAMTDEDWIASNAVTDDEAWAQGIQQSFGFDIRPFIGRSLRGIVHSV